MLDNPATVRLHDRDHCPENLPGNPGFRAFQADKDARELITDVRELDPREIWGRLNRWGHEKPERLIAAMVSLAAMADPDQITSGPPEWTAEIGGTRALHPDYRTPDPRSVPNSPNERHAAIDRLVLSGLSTRAVAERVGCTRRTVERRRQVIRDHQAAFMRRTTEQDSETAA